MGDQHECLTGILLLAEDVGAFLGEGRVSDGEYLVDDSTSASAWTMTAKAGLTIIPDE